MRRLTLLAVAVLAVARKSEPDKRSGVVRAGACHPGFSTSPDTGRCRVP